MHVYMGVPDNYEQDTCTYRLYGMNRASFVVCLVINIYVTSNLTSVCILLKVLHIALYVHNLVYLCLCFIGIITACIIININVII